MLTKVVGSGFALAMVLLHVFIPALYAQCKDLHPTFNASNELLFRVLGGIVEAKVVDRPSEHSIKLLSHGAFDTNEFAGLYVRPNTLSIVGARIKSANSGSDNLSFILTGFMDAKERVRWMALLADSKHKVSMLHNFEDAWSCEGVPGVLSLDLLPAPPNFERELSVIDIVDPELVYQQLGW